MREFVFLGVELDCSRALTAAGGLPGWTRPKPLPVPPNYWPMPATMPNGYMRATGSNGGVESLNSSQLAAGGETAQQSVAHPHEHRTHASTRLWQKVGRLNHLQRLHEQHGRSLEHPKPATQLAEAAIRLLADALRRWLHSRNQEWFSAVQSRLPPRMEHLASGLAKQ